MYVHARKKALMTLKRRSARVYGELLGHKMRLIDVMDGGIPLADWAHFLYDDQQLPRIRKFLYEEYYLLLDYDPFLSRSATARAVNDFHDLHGELEHFMRSVFLDRVEWYRFRTRFHHVHGKEMSTDTPEEGFTHPQLREAHEALGTANEYALFNLDALLALLDTRLSALDRRISLGQPWAAIKQGLESEFRLWMSGR